MEEIKDSAVVENSGNPESEPKQDESVITETPEVGEGAQKENNESAQKKELTPELQDKYKEMQRDYTEKTTKLANREKEIEEKLKSYEEKIRIFDVINSNPEAVEAVKRAFGRKEVKEPTEDEIIEKYGSVERYQLQKKIDEIDRKTRELDEKVGKTAQTVEDERRARQVMEYGSIKGNEDFWELEEAGLVNPLITRLRQENPKEDDLKLLSEAHRQAREMVANIGMKYVQKEQAKQKELIAKKKNETMDRGGSSAGATETRPKTYREQLEADAKKLGIPIP